MMLVYYMRVTWVSGLAFLVAFILTFWPSRHRMIAAAIFWTIGIFAISGFHAYDMFARGAIGSAFSSSGPFPLFSWLVPVGSLGLAFTESVLLFPWIPRERALRIGRVIFLIILPPCLILLSLSSRTKDFWPFPLGVSALGYPLLWFRIREYSNDRNDKQ